MLNINWNKDSEFGGAELDSLIQESAPLLAKAKSSPAEYADSLGWLDVDRWAGEDAVNRLEEIAAHVRKNADAFVLIGVGGSNNAARSVIEALANGTGPEIIYAGNTLSANAMNKLVKKLAGRDFFVDCIAKNFETLEPGASFRVLRALLREKYGDAYASRVITTGTPGSHLELLSREQGYTFLPFPTDIGGRYTAISNVGLLPMAVAGLDIRKIVQGARDMRSELFSLQPSENPALRYACARNFFYRRGFRLEMLSCFEPQMRWFYKWWVQLFAESEGKDGKGLFPTASEFSEELHSVGQYIQEGSPLLFETFLDVARQQDSFVLKPDGVDDHFSYLDGKDFWHINKAALDATKKAHSGRLPCLTLTVDRIDEHHFGRLFYFFEFACFLSGMLLGINPFDQPGVEAYKGWMFQALGKN